MKKTKTMIIATLTVIIISNCKKEDEIVFGTVNDIDGNTYKTVTIGSQTWMTENLKVTNFSNGDPIQNVINNNQWANLSTSATCWYDNNESTYGDEYGALYNYYAVADMRNICPTGWQIPTKTDCEILESTLGGHNIAGEKLKEMGTTHWYSPNEQCASDESNFSARAGGDRSPEGSFEYLKQTAFFWTSTSESSLNAYWYILSYEVPNFFIDPAYKKYGCSVRCIKMSNLK
jgi:uncharacterized protein (TIGR02145 family)